MWKQNTYNMEGTRPECGSRVHIIWKLPGRNVEAEHIYFESYLAGLWKQGTYNMKATRPECGSRVHII